MTIPVERPDTRWARLHPKKTTTSVSDEEQAVLAREMVADLHRLIEALDRRVPRLERLGEAQIASDAAGLRANAVRLIEQMENIAEAGTVSTE